MLKYKLYNIKETLCWGIDVYTRNVIINILPLNYVEV